jgi:hypothetical protein
VAITYRNQGNAYYRDDQQTRAYQRGQIVPYDVNGAPPAGGGSGGTTTNALTFNSSGAGAASGSAFDGSAALSISYNSIGAQPAGAYLTGNQTITLSGDLSGSGATSIAATIANGAVTLAKMANMATASLIYRKSAGSGAPEVNSLATLKTDLGLTGTNSGDQTITLTGDVTGSGSGSFAATIGAGAVTLAKMANVNSGTVFYRKTASAGAPETQTLATLKTDLGLTGTNSGDQTITLTGDVTGSGTGSFSATISANAVTFSKLVAATAAGIVGATAAGNFAQLTPVQAKGVLALTAADVSGLAAIATSGSASDLGAGTVPAARMPAFTGDVTSSAGTVALTIGTNAVTFSKFVAATAAGIVGATAAGNFAQLTSAQAKSVLALTASDISGLAAVAISGSAADLIDGAQVLAQSAIAASVTGTVTKTSLATIVIPAGAMGANGRIEVEAYFTVTSNTNSKTVNMELAGSLLGGGANLNASVTSGRLKVVSANRNSQSSQYNVR